MGNDGVLHLVADEETMERALNSLDFPRAQILSDVASFWLVRSRSADPFSSNAVSVADLGCQHWTCMRSTHTGLLRSFLSVLLKWLKEHLKSTAQFQACIAIV